ncbi:MAG: hypothetical protein LUE08_09115 [Akkermansiaceae bacterium]|nr:hypothetical protein [Akkermansiaceae bacterium]
MRKIHTRRSFSNGVSLGYLAWMAALAVLLIAGGCYYAVLKNEQIVLKRDIEKIHLKTASCRLAAEQYRAKAAARVNRWAIRDRLSQDDSLLRDITSSQIEIAERQPRRTVAGLHPTTPPCP